MPVIKPQRACRSPECGPCPTRIGWRTPPFCELKQKHRDCRCAKTLCRCSDTKPYRPSPEWPKVNYKRRDPPYLLPKLPDWGPNPHIVYKQPKHKTDGPRYI